jgi:hypothetical protein
MASSIPQQIITSPVQSNFRTLGDQAVTSDVERSEPIKGIKRPELILAEVHRLRSSFAFNESLSCLEVTLPGDRSFVTTHTRDGDGPIIIR